MDDEDAAVTRAAELLLDVVEQRLLKVPVGKPAETVIVAIIVVLHSGDSGVVNTKG